MSEDKEFEEYWAKVVNDLRILQIDPGCKSLAKWTWDAGFAAGWKDCYTSYALDKE
jgi:hypothetical protein